MAVRVCVAVPALGLLRAVRPAAPRVPFTASWLIECACSAECVRALDLWLGLVHEPLFVGGSAVLLPGECVPDHGE